MSAWSLFRPDKIVRFKTDENLPIEVVEQIKASGHDALSVVDQGPGGAPDPSIAQVCTAEDRVLVTLDTDFSDIRAYPPGSHPGIIVFRLARQDKQTVLDVTKRLLVALETEVLAGALWVVDERRIRVRENT